MRQDNPGGIAMPSDEIAHLRNRLLRLLKLAELNAPEVVKAHYLMAVIVPQMIRIVGVRAAAEEMTKLISRAMCLHTGVCTDCQKVPATREDLCDKCHTEHEAFFAEADRDDPDIVDDVPQEFLQFVARTTAKDGIETTPDEVRGVQLHLNRAVREKARLMGIACPTSEMEMTGWVARVMKDAKGKKNLGKL